MTYYDQVAEAVAHLKERVGSLAARVGIVLGSGLGAAAQAVENPTIVPYSEIPHFPQSTVEGHSGRMVAGLLGGAPVIIMQGRVHSYEGYSPLEVTFPMRVLGMLGMRAVVLTNAAGGIHPAYHVGELVLISDHINMMGWNPLTGPNEPRFAIHAGAGQRFFDMTEAYSWHLRAVAKEEAHEDGFSSRRACTWPRRGRALKRRRRFALFARWAQRWWACLPCPKQLWRGTWELKCWEYRA